MGRCHPGGHRQVTVSLVDPSAFEVGEPEKTGGLVRFHAATELCELLLGQRIRELRDRLGASFNEMRART